MSEPPSAEVQRIGTPGPNAEQTLEEVCDAIWKLTEDVLELLRSHATSQVQAHKRPDVLWVDDVTRAQGNTVIAIKQLCDIYPEGVTLKKLAETIGVTPAAASVMVDLLVAKKMIKRTRSKNDRRAILVRLTPQTAQLFEISTRSLGEAVMSLAEDVGTDVLRDWERILVTVSAVLRRKMGINVSDHSEMPDEAETPGSPPEDVHEPGTDDEM